MEASSLISIHGTTWICSAGPVHCTIVTAIACVVPEPIACSSRGLRNAAT